MLIAWEPLDVASAFQGGPRTPAREKESTMFWLLLLTAAAAVAVGGFFGFSRMSRRADRIREYDQRAGQQIDEARTMRDLWR